MAFAADWLALREPADRAARNAGLAQRAARAAGPEPVIVDLGCGTGATWRALSPLLSDSARWCFVDNDPELLAAAAAATNDGRTTIDTVEADIADIPSLPLLGATLITASALLDLTTQSWIEALARRLRVPFYAALSYSGSMRWTPADSRDDRVTEFFNRHQRGDKGLGPALGPAAGECAATVFERAGFEVHRADSPWRLGPDMAALQRELTDGIARAAGEAGVTDADAWGRHRRAAAASATCEISHVDILALPQPSDDGAPVADR